MQQLKAFAERWMAQPVFRPPADLYAKVAGNVGITLYRDERYQVTLWACEPNSDVGDHAHPNANGIAVRVGGDMRFRVNGIPTARADMSLAQLCGRRAMSLDLPAGTSHGVAVGEHGASFLAFTEWLASEPKSVHLDWQGKPLDAAHAAELAERV